MQIIEISWSIAYFGILTEEVTIEFDGCDETLEAAGFETSGGLLDWFAILFDAREKTFFNPGLLTDSELRRSTASRYACSNVFFSNCWGLTGAGIDGPAEEGEGWRGFFSMFGGFGIAVAGGSRGDDWAIFIICFCKSCPSPSISSYAWSYEQLNEKNRSKFGPQIPYYNLYQLFIRGPVTITLFFTSFGRDLKSSKTPFPQKNNNLPSI